MKLLAAAALSALALAGTASTDVFQVVPAVSTPAASPFLQPWILRKSAALMRGDPDQAAPALSGFGIASRRVSYSVSEPSEVVVAVQRRIAGITLTLSTALIQNAPAGASTKRSMSESPRASCRATEPNTASRE